MIPRLTRTGVRLVRRLVAWALAVGMLAVMVDTMRRGPVLLWAAWRWVNTWPAWVLVSVAAVFIGEAWYTDHRRGRS